MEEETKDVSLLFIRLIGEENDGYYRYEFIFTDNPDEAWGDDWEYKPSGLVNTLIPSDEYITEIHIVKTKIKFDLIQNNMCFSMQDCIDGIISLCFSQINDEESIYYNEEPLKFDFGETQEEVRERLKNCGLTLCGLKEIEIDDEPLVPEKAKPEKEEEKIKYEEVISIEIGQEISFDLINQILFDLAYERVDYIYKKAQYTIRGHIVDIFPIYSSYMKGYDDEVTDVKHPYRISFIGNDVESMFTYDLDTQEKIEDVYKITILKLEDNG